MYSLDNYGVVYTPRKLAGFVADLLLDAYAADGRQEAEVRVLDPACGEGVLLEELEKRLRMRTGASVSCFGIDVDSRVISSNRRRFGPERYVFLTQNTIVPSSKVKACDYWKNRLGCISFVIANPPWSAEKVFERKTLDGAGYCLDVGQYDSYVLFIELCLKLAAPGALLAFIVPDSLFSGENKPLRAYMLENTQIKVLARLGERLFPNVNRAASVIVLQKSLPSDGTRTRCYRLNTLDRRRFLDGGLDLYQNYREKGHEVLQARFLKNQNCVFDIDTREEEELLLKKIESGSIDWKKTFRFGRGVEISKSGAVVTCRHCGMAQGYTKKQLAAGSKKCQFCGEDISLAETELSLIISDEKKPGYKAMYVGENVHRYRLDGVKYIKTNVRGINYKNEEQYRPPKILIRKTGLGIYACLDRKSTYTSQTVYSINYLEAANSVPLEYYLGVLNSRLLYYYYLKRYGENEWKSHPYLTKDIIFSFPVRDASACGMEMVLRIAELAKKLQEDYSRELDMQLEETVMRAYGITGAERALISETLNELPDLSAINQMRMTDGEKDVQIHRK